jgi:phenylalanyl-tRNA synthetase beta chain
MAALGLREIVNYSFVSEKLLDTFDTAGAGRRLKIPRPVSADHTILRDSLLPQMAETLGRNRSRQVEEAAFFELARVFAGTETQPYDEETRIAVGLMGAVKHDLLQKRQAPTESEIFAWLKGILNNFYEKLMQEEGRSNQREMDSGRGLTLGEINGNLPNGFYTDCFKPNRCAQITLRGKPCGIMGLLKDEIRREWRITEPVGLMELTLDPFIKDAFRTPQAATLPMFPSITRDIALKAPFSIRHADITKTIWKNAPKELTALALFDIYTGKEIGTGFKSMAYSLTYQSLERTLTDEEVNTLHESVKKQLKSELMVDIREG